jgi:hypothetical protein
MPAPNHVTVSVRDLHGSQGAAAPCATFTNFKGEHYSNAAPLRRHPAKNHSDLGIYLRSTLRDIFYASQCDRAVIVVSHTTGNASRPPPITGRSSHCARVALGAGQRSLLIVVIER